MAVHRRDVTLTRRPDVVVRTSGRRRAASARRRPSAGPMSKRRPNDVGTTSVLADLSHVVWTSARRRCVYWAIASPVTDDERH